MFKLLNSLLYIDITCEEVLLGKVMIGMNSFWRGPTFQGMFPSLWWLLPVMLMNPYSRHGLFIWKVRRCLILPSVVQMFHQGRMTSCIGLIMSIFLILGWSFLLVNPIVSTIYTSMGCHVLHKICFLYFFKVV